MRDSVGFVIWKFICGVSVAVDDLAQHEFNGERNYCRLNPTPLRRLQVNGEFSEILARL